MTCEIGFRLKDNDPSSAHHSRLRENLEKLCVIFFTQRFCNFSSSLPYLSQHGVWWVLLLRTRLLSFQIVNLSFSHISFYEKTRQVSVNRFFIVYLPRKQTLRKYEYSIKRLWLTDSQIGTSRATCVSRTCVQNQLTLNCYNATLRHCNKHDDGTDV